MPQGFLGGWEFGIALFIGLVISGSYGRGDARRDVGRLLGAVLFATALALWSRIWFDGVFTVLLQFAVTCLVVWVSLTVERFLIDGLTARLLPYKSRAERVVFVSSESDEDDDGIVAGVEANPAMPAVGRLNVDRNARRTELNPVEELRHLIRSTETDTVILSGRLDESVFQKIVREATAAGCRVLSVSRMSRAGGLRPAAVWYGAIPFVELSAPALKAQELFIKRMTDLLVAIAGLTVLLPVFAVIAVVIRLDSPGPVFFKQERVGRLGRLFRVWKFRTMRHGVSEEMHRQYVSQLIRGSGTKSPPPGDRPVFKLQRDPRITSVGRVLRRLSIDELPQLINVLTGEMSLVGPRPPLPYEVEEYQGWQYGRLTVRPGITGLWQVSGRNTLSYLEMCQLDLVYVENWSLWVDLKILLKTLPVVLLNTGRAG
jgi:exopolysaccharide biosynthesis polyprenyl glycosylphosphotransferase